MRQSNKPSEPDEPPAEQTDETTAITDFDGLRADQQDRQVWQVLNLSNDPPTRYKINTDAGTCSCPDTEYNRGMVETCKHLAFVLAGNGRTLADKEPLNVSQTINGPSTTTDAEPDSDASADADDDADDEDSPVTTDGVGADDNQQQLVREVEKWIESAAEFNGDIDPAIAAVEWAHFDDGDFAGEGVHIELTPFAAGYWSDGEWQDREGYDAAREALADILSNQAEIIYSGSPHYVNFVPESDVLEVTA